MAVGLVHYVPPETRSDLNLISAAPDWLTATTQTRQRSDVLEHFAMVLLRKREREGYEVRDWHANGYLGDTTDGISVGILGDNCMVRLSGEMAQRYAGVTLEMVDHVSRFDWQVTVQDEDLERDWAQIALWYAQEDPRCKQRKTTLTAIISSRGGHTAYIGRRVSDRFFRVYDKTAESEGLFPNRSWRFEVEYKGKRADAFRERWNRVVPQAPYAFGVVRAAFADYGIRVPAVGPSAFFSDKSPVGPSSDQRRLEYLERCIAPMVGRLVEVFGQARLRYILRLNDDPEENDRPW